MLVPPTVPDGSRWGLETGELAVRLARVAFLVSKSTAVDSVTTWVRSRNQTTSNQYAMYRSKPKRITQNPNRLVAKTQTSNTILSCIFGTLQNVASNSHRRTFPPETLHFRRKTISPKKL